METVLAIVFVIAFLVLTHELGHFVVARRAGVRVLEFGFGYPPRLFALRRGQTEYSFNLLPLGGFVKMLGEEDPSEPDSLAAKGPGTRLLVMSAGSALHLLLALVIFSIGFMMPRQELVGEVQVQEVAAGSPAQAAGVRAEDIIVAINGQPVESLVEVRRHIYSNLGQEISLLLRRGDGEPRRIQVVPRPKPPEGEGAVGVLLGYLNPVTITRAYPLWEAVPLAVGQSLYILDLTKDAILGMVFRGDISQVAGPVGIAQITGEVASTGLSPLMEWLGLLALNLALLNILPIPMLDGGRMIFVVAEVLRGGRRVPPEREAMVHLIGFILLLTFIAVVSFNDIMRLISGGSLIQ